MPIFVATNIFLIIPIRKRINVMAKKQPSKPTNTPKIAKPKPPKKEGNAYDKIFKEVVEKIFRPLVEKRLGVKIVKATPLKEKMQTTIEVEMDFFYEILTDTGERFILHLEFESGINSAMIYRVGEYHGMAQKRHKLPIRHIVVYLGEEPPTMRTQLKPEEVFTGFDLLNVQALNTDELLSSQVPEVVLIAILSNYPKEEAETVLRTIILNLKNLIQNKKVLKRYINQLMMLSRLRKIEELTIKIAEEMPIHYDIETDALYLRGIEKGAIIKDYLFIHYFLSNNNHSEQEIADIVGVTLTFVEKVKNDFIFVQNLLLSSDYNDKKIARLTTAPLAFVKKIRLELEQKNES